MMPTPIEDTVLSLLDSVIIALAKHQAYSNEVKYVVLDDSSRCCSFREFEKVAETIYFKAGVQISTELKIVGAEWYLERNEANNKWQYKMRPLEGAYISDVGVDDLLKGQA